MLGFLSPRLRTDFFANLVILKIRFRHVGGIFYLTFGDPIAPSFFSLGLRIKEVLSPHPKICSPLSKLKTFPEDDV